MLADILHFIEFVFLFALALIALFIVMLIVVSMMPKDNPLKMMLSALAHRVGATAGLMVLDPVVTCRSWVRCGISQPSRGLSIFGIRSSNGCRPCKRR